MKHNLAYELRGRVLQLSSGPFVMSQEDVLGPPEMIDLQ